MDIDSGAVEIARLRFWLALVVDEEQPRPLPNLDYKIMQGDSLLESFEGVSLNSLHVPRAHEARIIEKSGQIGLFPDQRPLFQYTNKKRAEEIVALLHTYFGEIEPGRKQELHREIDRFVLDHIDYNLRLAEEQLEKAFRSAALWGLQAGKFHVLRQGELVLYAEAIGEDGVTLKNIFIKQRNEEREQIWVAQKGRYWMDNETGDR